MAPIMKTMLEKRATKARSGLVFPSKNHVHRQGVDKLFRRLVNKAGLNDGIDDPRQRVVFHTLRHTFASRLALQRETLMTIKELLGHKAIQMAMRYAHLIPDQKRKAVELLARRYSL